MSAETRRSRQIASTNVSNVITGSAFISTDDGQSQETPRDFLHHSGANKLLLDAMSVVLQRRPKNPIEFLSDHFSSLIEPKNNFQNAHERIRSVPYKKDVFESILVDVYQGFKEKRGKRWLSGLRGAEHNELIQFLLKNIPISFSEQMVKCLMRPERQSISFSTFRKNILTVLIFEDFIKTVKSIYKDIDFDGKGKANRQLCLSFLSELENMFLNSSDKECNMNDLKSTLLKYSETDELTTSNKLVMSLDEFVKMALDSVIKEPF